MDLIKRYEALKVKAQDVDTALRINLERASDLKSEIKSSLVDMGFKNRKELQAIAKEKYDAGNKNAFSIKMLGTWFEYISAFDLIEEVKVELIKKIGLEKLESDHKISKKAIDDIIDMKNTIKEAYKTYGYEYLADFALNEENPIYTRIAKDAEIRAEKEWLRLSKEERKDKPLEEYKKEFLKEHSQKIKNDSRAHFIAELKEAQFDITYLERWVGNIPDIDDPIVAVMVKAIKLQDMKARKDGIEFVNK